MTPLPADFDAREFALQLAVVAERLDQRSTRAVEQLERTSAEFRREAASAANALENERRQAAVERAAAVQARARLLCIASGGLLIGAMIAVAGATFAVAGATFAVASAKRELASISRDQKLLQAINAADLTLCGSRVCARLEPDQLDANGEESYRTVAAR